MRYSPLRVQNGIGINAAYITIDDFDNLAQSVEVNGLESNGGLIDVEVIDGIENSGVITINDLETSGSSINGYKSWAGLIWANHLNISNVHASETATSTVSRGIYFSYGEPSVDFDYSVNITEISNIRGVNQASGVENTARIRWGTSFQYPKMIGNELSISYITATKGSAYGIKGEALSMDIDDISIEQINAGSEGDAYGYYAEKLDFSDNDTSVSVASLLSADTLTIRDVSAINGNAYGLQVDNASAYPNYFEKENLTDIQNITIENISGAKKSVGMSVLGGSLIAKQVCIKNVGGSEDSAIPSTLIDATKNALINLESVNITHANLDKDNFSYLGHFHDSASDDNFTVSSIALRSTQNSDINISSKDQSTHRYIMGDLVAGRGSNELEEVAGKISISGGVNEIYGDVYAGNGGQITLSLGTGSVLEGQIDDYHELNSEEVGEVFKNSVFKDDDGNELEVTSAGKVDLKLDGAIWYARGQSFVDTISLNSGGTIDLSKNSNSSVSIANLSGNGNFTMELGAYSESGEIQSDMLYIQNVSEGSHFTINAKFNDTIKSIEDLVDLRFATVGSGASANLFSISIIDEGFYNHSVSIGQENYQIGDADNERFNGTGDGKGEYKPGEDAIDAIYGKETTEGVSLASEGETSQNYFIKDVFGSESEGNSSLSDAGNALLATARGTYWTSVEIDRLTNRMGDARYANSGEDGLWIRLRQSRLGTDTDEGDFKSDNTVYQVGYDHAFQRDGGRQLVGIAFDYMDTDLDYKGISGEGNTDRYGITAYTTWLADNGFYVDVVGKWGRLDNDFDIINGSGGRVKADYDNNMWAISAEVGRKLSNPKTGMFIEPNAQLQYTMVTDAQYSTNQGTRVDQDRIDSVIGRMGVRIGRAFGEEQNHNIYAKADMFREFMGEQKIHVKDVTTRVKGDTITVQNKGFWFDMGGGFQSQLGRDAYAYADVEYRFGNDLDKSWIVNAGMRYEF